MRGDAPNTRADCECHFDHLIERGFVTGGAERAIILGLINRFQSDAGVENTSAARTENIPG